MVRSQLVIKLARNYVATVENIDVVLGDIVEAYLKEDVAIGAKEGIKKTVKDMVKETKSAPPFGAPVHRKDGMYNGHKFPVKKNRIAGTFKKHITYSVYGYGMHTEGVWRVRSPEFRLTHLLENGHEQYVFGKKKGYTEGLNFVQRARDVAEHEVISNIIEAISDHALSGKGSGKDEQGD